MKLERKPLPAVDMPVPGQRAFAINENNHLIVGVVVGWNVHAWRNPDAEPTISVDIEVTDPIDGEKRIYAVDRDDVAGSGHMLADRIAERTP